jgi:hypothetical protein
VSIDAAMTVQSFTANNINQTIFLKGITCKVSRNSRLNRILTHGVYRTSPLFLDAGHLATSFSIAIWIVWAAPLFGYTGQERDRQWAVGDSLLFHWMECFRGALDGS